MTVVALLLLVAPVVGLGQGVNFQIPEQDLAKALVTLAVRSGRNIIFPPALTAGRRSRPVAGATDFAEALKIMLAGSRLRATIQRDGSVIVAAAPEIAAGEPPAARATNRSAQRPPEQTSVSAVIVTARLARSFPPLGSSALSGSLSTADLAVNPGGPVLDLLAALPGVAIINGGQYAANAVPIDLAGRGEANYASLRGLEASFNLVSVNGVEAALSEPYSRGVQLNLLPASGLAQVTVSKSLTPDLAGDAIGGVIDFRTPNAFDFPGGTHAAVSASGQVEDEALRYGRPPLGGSLSAEASGVFGADGELGVYAGGYYGGESYSNGIVDGIYPAATNSMFAYALQTATGASAPGLDPAANLVLTGLDVGLTTGTTQRYGGSLALDWRPRSGLSAYLRLTLAEARTRQETFYSQIYGNLVASRPVGAQGLYQPVIGYVQPRYYYETNPEAALLDTLQIGGLARAGRWAIRARGYASWGKTDDPNHFEISGRDPEVAPGLPFGGGMLFGDAGGVPVPLLNAQGQQALADAADYGARRAGELSRELSEQIKLGAKLDADYRLTAAASLAMGVDVTGARRGHTYRDYTSGLLFTTDANDPTLASLGILSGSVAASVPGVFRFPLPTVDAGKAWALFNSNLAQTGGLANAIDGCANLYVNNFNCDTQHGSEARVSAYLLGRFQLGDLEIEPGLRYDYNLIRNRFWVLPHPFTSLETPGYFASDRTVYREALPRLTLTYRPQAFAAYSGAIWTSYAPPALYQLGGGTQVGESGGGAGNGGTTTVLEGNPGLKPVRAINIDLAADWAGLKGGQLSAAIFYKALRRYIFDSVNAFSDPVATAMGDLVITQPHNGGAGEVYGLELTARQNFAGLPSPWNRIGLNGALTLEHSRVDTLEPGLSSHERLLNQPDVDVNLQATYAIGAGDLALTYEYRGAYVAQYGVLGSSSALDSWVRDTRRLNFAATYRPTPQLAMSLSVANILNDISYHATIGQHAETIPSLVYSGRTFVLTTKWVY